MSIEADIKGTADFESLQDDRMICGIRNSDHVLQRLEGDEKLVVFFNPNFLGRGVEVMNDDGNVNIRLTAASNSEEVTLFFRLITKICDRNGRDEFELEGEKRKLVELTGTDRWDEEPPMELWNEVERSNLSSFEVTMELIGLHDDLTIFGVRNPISFDRGMTEDFRDDFSKYEKFLHKMQTKYDYYATPGLAEDSNKGIGFGVFTVELGQKMVVPRDPNKGDFWMPEGFEVDEWLIGDGNSGLVRYEDFMKHCGEKRKYDAARVMVKVSRTKFENLAREFPATFE